MTDRSQIETAAAFFERYRDGWVSVMDGGAAPLNIRFHKNGEDIGTFGVLPRGLSIGASRRYPPEAEITALVSGLGLPWPPP